MRVVMLLVLCCVVGVLSGCPAITPSQRAAVHERVVASDAAEAQLDARLSQILILPGDAARPYHILGTVRVESAHGNCSPTLVRRAAVERYPTVDAVIGFIAYGGTSNPVGPNVVGCEGTAVRFLETSK